MSDPQPDPVVLALKHVRDRSLGGPLGDEARVTLNFHPDRLVGDVPILQAMARDGTYRSQFETRTSNGGLTAHHGGDRWVWESRPSTRTRAGQAWPHRIENRSLVPPAGWVGAAHCAHST